MSTLKTHNLQSSDSGSVNIALAPNAGMVVAGISTFNNKVLLGTDTEGHSNADDLTIATTDHTGITLRSATNRNGSVFFSDGTSGADEYRGWIQYTHTSDYLTFGTNAGERLRIDSSGNMGLGIAGAISDARFRIKGANNNTSAFNDGLMVTSNNETVYKKYSWMGIETKGGLSFHETNSGSLVETMRIDSSGRVIIGGTSPLTDAQLTISANDAPAMAFQRSGSGKFESAIGMETNSALRFYTGADSGSISGLTERMQIDAGGNMGLGLTPAYSGLFGGAQRTFHIGGTAAPCLRITSSTSGQADLVVHAGNSARRVDIANLTANGAISIWTKPSSGSIAERLKISPAGYVTKPATPAFFANHTGAGNSIIGTLPYNTSGAGYYNNGGHLNVGTGKFTAPVNGIYTFHFHGFFQVNQSSGYFEVIIRRTNSNGSGALSLTRQYGYRNQPTNQYGPSISMHCTCYLTAGQRVEVVTGGQSFHGSNGYYFGGHLVG